MQLYMSWYIISFFGFIFTSWIFFIFFKYSCTNIFHRRSLYTFHDDVIKWEHFPRNWPFVREIHRSPVNFPHKGQWRGALMFSLIYAWINDWVNNREAGDLRRQHGHYDVIVMPFKCCFNKKSACNKAFHQPRIHVIGRSWVRVSPGVRYFPSKKILIVSRTIFFSSRKFITT